MANNQSVLSPRVPSFQGTLSSESILSPEQGGHGAAWSQPAGSGAATRAFWVFPTAHPAQLGLESAAFGTYWAGMASRVLRCQSREDGVLGVRRPSSSVETCLRPWPPLGLGAKGGPQRDVLPSLGPWAWVGGTTGPGFSWQSWVLFVLSAPPGGIQCHLAQRMVPLAPLSHWPRPSKFTPL